MKLANIKFIPIILSVFFLFLQYQLWFEAGGVIDLFRLKKQVTSQTNQNILFKKENDQLLVQIEHLKTNSDAVESRARQELGMIKKDETFYQVIDP